MQAGTPDALPDAGQPLAEALLDALPQTQCRRCGYADCRAYAEAIAIEGVDVNRCPPGGAEGVVRLAAIAGRAVLPLDPECGSEGPRLLARVDEPACIGCALCLKACPVDAILGAAKQTHTVIDALCTGCELCVPVCPVDCIVLVDASGEATGWDAWSAAEADRARRRYAGHAARLAEGATGRQPADLASAVAGSGGTPGAARDAIAAAFARARAARAAR